jgi:hypothetical protein
MSICISLPDINWDGALHITIFILGALAYRAIEFVGCMFGTHIRRL